jgi:hypothetical protein
LKILDSPGPGLSEFRTAPLWNNPDGSATETGMRLGTLERLVSRMGERKNENNGYDGQTELLATVFLQSNTAQPPAKNRAAIGTARSTYQRRLQQETVDDQQLK